MYDFLLNILMFILAVLVIFIVLKFVFKLSLKLIYKFLLNSLIGFIILTICNYIPGLNIHINLLSSFITGAFGVPGVILIIILTLLHVI